MRSLLLAGLALLAAGCAPTYPVVAEHPGTANAPVEARPAPTPATPAPQPAPQSETPAAPPRSLLPQSTAQRRDQCGAAELQSLIGRPRTEIPVPLDPRRQRVACTTCPAAEDSDPARLNFLFDAQTGRIRQIRCG
ncbi:peptidase inhibitor I78 [Phenylobacterium sp.]|uniref:peptidase inhibitor I78 n=1 Tax=Phenylobacterium sp. TaxID=1871053 RepID=UPI002C953D8B|nr:peptidase inhibitor I78 [Phenylobacterium sp.]HLZ75196.1 peptidase inhibitor I78 [Phenylobacterium sp.]